jgi:HEAT repeat protein
MDIQVERPEAIHRNVYALMEQLGDKNHPQLRVNAAQALEDLGDVRAVSALIEGLSDDDPEVRKYSAKALVKFRSVRAVDALIERLKDRNECWATRRFAAESLQKTKGFRATAALAQYQSEISSDMPAIPEGNALFEEACREGSSAGSVKGL